MPKKSKPDDDDCDCLACRLQGAIIDQVGQMAEEDDSLKIDARETLDALLPTVGMLLTVIDYADAEKYWLAVLSERSAAMMPEGVDFGDAYKGRA